VTWCRSCPSMNLGIPTPSRYASELYAVSLIGGPGFSHSLGHKPPLANDSSGVGTTAIEINGLIDCTHPGALDMHSLVPSVGMGVCRRAQ